MLVGDVDFGEVLLLVFVEWKSKGTELDLGRPVVRALLFPLLDCLVEFCFWVEVEDDVLLLRVAGLEAVVGRGGAALFAELFVTIFLEAEVLFTLVLIWFYNQSYIFVWELSMLKVY